MLCNSGCFGWGVTNRLLCYRYSLLELLTGITFFPIISVTTRRSLITWTCRVIALVLSIILFVVLIRNFYTSDPYAGTCLP
ncbi:hypothetical protein GYMLUDRAFT_263916 [Collybiopsis luxurians FD-317 M1]|uniref:Uncharacterized protein n=1 Tax=Collybiopsis luxurians FD-317 M1 TaxID=944289 RepID=A0A0D0BM12_9AGAR|nr:hypothetical protein GYMLUDRAFT_263916 [Collybiopsis luxurians FD-317 M1]